MSAVYALTLLTPACRRGQDLPTGAQAGQPRATADVRPPADAEPWQIALREYDGAIHFDAWPEPQAVNQPIEAGPSPESVPLDGHCGYVVREDVDGQGNLQSCDVEPKPCETSPGLDLDPGIRPHVGALPGTCRGPLSLPCCFSRRGLAAVPGSPDGGCPANSRRLP